MIGRREAFELVLELDVLSQQGAIERTEEPAAVLTGHQRLHRLSITRARREGRARGKGNGLKYSVGIVLLLDISLLQLN